MPTLAVKRDLLFRAIGRTFTDDEFDDLCFQFGIELDEVTSERQQVAREQGTVAAAALSDEVVYKIELPANRYDLLSMEGLARAIRCYLQLPGSERPKFTLLPATTTLTIDRSVGAVRPFVVAAILRNIVFNQDRYDGFIELQDKLHNGIGRKRTIVSVGTHDLDTLTGPFRYSALPPQAIHFRPLNQAKEMNGHELMAHYEGDLKIRKFLSIIKDSPLYPVIVDSDGTIASLPPIINSDHSKIRLATRNVFIEVTGTDLGKLQTALNVIVTAFSEHCERPFTVEAVEVLMADGSSLSTPNLSSRFERVTVQYINRCIGVQLAAEEICKLLKKMMLSGEMIDASTVNVEIPAIRSDILHACDIMEDVAIAYGFNNIERTLPKTLSAPASASPVNRLTDLLRREVALTGYTEVLTLTLCSKKENFDFLRRKDPGNEAVVLSNPKTLEYEVVHTSLIPEMLKTVASNKSHGLPLKIFQIADVVLLDDKTAEGTRNERRLCAVYVGRQSSGFEIIHGLVDRVLQMLAVPSNDYSIRPSSLPWLLPGRQAEVLFKDRVIGSFGILHPDVLSNFDIPNVASLMEINIEPFL